MADPLVSTDWLAGRLGGPDVQVIDATLPLVGQPGHGRDSYTAAHIAGAVFFDINGICDRDTDLPHMLPTPQAFAEAAGGLGLRRDATVVVYDAHGIYSAPRVWWTLRAMGFPTVRVLDGGLRKWRAEDRPVENAEPEPPSTQLEPVFDPTLVRDLLAVQNLLGRREAQLLDARSADRFYGRAPEPRASLRSGHMPGALNLPFQAVIREDGTMKDAADLRAAFEGASVDLDQPIVTTCGSGVTASILALALARLGREDVAVYDGSWSEWGARSDTAVTTGA